ncbi:MAG: hypothetical protein AAF483_01205 [Planctomycetota bacterium]
MKSHSACTLFCFVVLAISCTCQNKTVHAQLNVLSEGNAIEKWRESQIEVLEDQSPGAKSTAFREEVAAQKKWLQAWQPGQLTAQPMWEKNGEVKRITEPVLDPNQIAAPLRKRLLGPAAKPSARDTMQLQALLKKHPDDLGVRQLQLHWLDQLQFRKKYTQEIAQSASALAIMLQSEDQTQEIKFARAFCLYRAGRALAYRELPDVLEERPIENPKEHESQLLATHAQLVDLVGAGRPEFILLEIRMMRRDNWFGRALALLEGYGSVIEPKWFLKKRRDLLKELSWEAAYDEAAAIYAKEFPEAVAKEKKG